MILPWIVFVLVIGAVVAWASELLGKIWPRVVSSVVALASLVLVAVLWRQHVQQVELVPDAGPWMLRYSAPWIPSLHIGFGLALDGLSLLLLALSSLLTLLAVWASWSSIQTRVGFFHFNLLLLMAALAVVFMASDLFLFYVGWELLLIPLYFLIALWGSRERRYYAGIKFFIFTQASGLLLLLAILGLHFAHRSATGVSTFDYFELLHTPLPLSTERWLLLGFFAAFAVKLPAVPLHTWLPDAHTEAPTAGSVVLAGLVLKVGAYGLIRFAVPLFPNAARELAPWGLALGVAGILYGAVVAFGQTDLKRLVAYTSVSHMGFVLLAVSAWNTLSLQGAMMVMLSHGVSTGALFILVGDFYDRTHTRELDQLGGLWSTAPKLSGAMLFFALATLGLPGLGNFVGEFLVLLGAFQASVPAASVATLGFIIATVYSLYMVQRALQGPNKAQWKLEDMTPREGIIQALLIAVLLWLGLYPQATLNTARAGVQALQASGAQTQLERPGSPDAAWANADPRTGGTRESSRPSTGSGRTGRSSGPMGRSAR